MSLRDKLTSMTPREQKLLSAFALLLGAFIFLGTPAYIYSELWSARERNDEIRQLLRRMDKGSELLAKRKRERQARGLLYAKPAPALASFIESMAASHALEVPESTDRPDNTLQGFTERVTVVKMRRVNLLPLVKVLEKIERSGHPVAITMLSIKARASVPDEYDVQLGVSAFDKKGAKPKTDEKKGPAKGKAPPKSTSKGPVKTTPRVPAPDRGKAPGLNPRPLKRPGKGQEL